LLTENGEGEDGHKTIEHQDTKQSNRTTSYKGIPHLCQKRHCIHPAPQEEFNPKRALDQFRDYFEIYDFEGGRRDMTHFGRFREHTETIQLKTFSNGNLDPRNPHVFVAREAIGAALREKMIHLAKTKLFT
jgi:hypothetical protein